MPRSEEYLLSGSGRGLVDVGHTTGDRPTTVGVGVSATPYVGAVWNIKSPEEYSGPFASINVTGSFGEYGVAASYFWDSAKDPFSEGTTKGFSIRYSPGAHLSLGWVSTIYTMVR
jgi:hypothetical protein